MPTSSYVVSGSYLYILLNALGSLIDDFIYRAIECSNGIPVRRYISLYYSRLKLLSHFASLFFQQLARSVYVYIKSRNTRFLHILACFCVERLFD